ncbi:unnamed protein product [Urochloa humidicola]
MDSEIEEPLRQESLSLSIEDSSLHGNGSAGENPTPDLVKSESDRIKIFYQTVGLAIMAFIMAALSSYKNTTSHSKAHLRSLLVAGSFLVFMTFLCAMILMMFDIVLYQRGRRRGRRWFLVLNILVVVTGTMLIVADTILVIVTNRKYMVLSVSVILVPVMALIGVVARAGAWMEEQLNPTLGSSRCEAAMKGTIDVATIGTIVSFTLQGTVIFGYLKAPGGNQAKRDPPLDLIACYATSTFSVIVMMLCATPLARLPDDMLKVLISVVMKLRHLVVIALVMMALVVAVEFLDGFIVLSFFPEAVAVVLYYAVEFFSAREPRGESSPHDFAFRIVATAGFTVMTGLYGAFLGTDHYSVYLKAAMFILLLAVLSSLSRLAIPLHVPDVGGAVALMALAFPAMAFLSACPLVLMVLYDHYLKR